jgi:hypothetical protein
MSSSTMKYGQLYDYLESLDYEAQIIEKHIVFRRPQRELPVILPKARKADEVRASHLAAVEKILVLDGVVAGGRLPSMPGRQYSALRPSGAKASQVKASMTKASQVKRSMTKASQVKRSMTKASHVKASLPKTSHFTSPVARASHVKAAKAKGPQS